MASSLGGLLLCWLVVLEHAGTGIVRSAGLIDYGEEFLFGDFWIAPESVGLLVGSVRRILMYCLCWGVCSGCGDGLGCVVIFVTVNQVLVRLWACCGQPV